MLNNAEAKRTASGNGELVMVPFGSRHLALSIEEYEKAMTLGEEIAGKKANAKSENKRPLASAEEVSKLFNVPLSGIYEKARRKMIPSYRVGKYVRFDPDELRELLRRPQEVVEQPQEIEPWLRS